MHRARHTYRPGSPVKPWFYAIGRHTAIDALRKKGRRREIEGMDEFIATTVSGPREDHDRGDDDVDLEGLVEKLPPKQKEALLLTKVSDLSIRDAATAMGTSESAVKVNVHRAVKTLRRFLDIGGKNGTGP